MTDHPIHLPVGVALRDAADALERVAEALRAASTATDIATDVMTPLPSFLSIAEACNVLGLSRPSVNRRIRDGALRSRKVGGRRLIPVAAVEELSQAGVTR